MKRLGLGDVACLGLRYGLGRQLRGCEYLPLVESGVEDLILGDVYACGQFRLLARCESGARRPCPSLIWERCDVYVFPGGDLPAPL
jgi:hypothetical protein